MNQENFDSNLAILLGNYPAIWKRSSSDFKNKLKKENAIQALAKELNAEVPYVISRIKALREKYRKEKQKMNSECRSGMSQVEREEWHLFKTLSFFGEVMTTRKTASNFPSTSKLTSLDEEIVEVTEYDKVETNVGNIFNEDSLFIDLNESNSDATLTNTDNEDKEICKTPSKFVEKSKTSKKRSRTHSSSDSDPIVASINRLVNAAESTASNIVQDECTSFGNFISDQLRLLNQESRSEVMFLIHKVIYDIKKIV